MREDPALLDFNGFRDMKRGRFYPKIPDTVWQIKIDRIDDFCNNECYSTSKALDKSTIVYDNISRKEAV